MMKAYASFPSTLRTCVRWACAALLACMLGLTWGCSCSAADSELLATTQEARQAAQGPPSSASRAQAAGQDADAGEEARAQEASPGEQEAADGDGRDVREAQEAAGDAGQAQAAAQAAAPAESGPSEPATPEEAPVADLISVTVVFDSSNAARYDGKYPSSLGSYTLSLKPGASVYDALVATGIPFSAQGGNYIASIGGIAEKQCGAGSGWMYAVNGTFPGVSAMRYALGEGDAVRWAYTVSMGDV